MLWHWPPDAVDRMTWDQFEAYRDLADEVIEQRQRQSRR